MMNVRLIILLLLVAVQLTDASAASRKAMRAQIAELQQQMTRPSRSEVELDPCEKMALEESKYLRAVGIATAKNISEAKSAAATDARNQLAQMIRVYVDGTTQNYYKNEDRNGRVTSYALGEMMMNNYVYQSVDLTKPINWSIYELSNGMAQVYVCMEMTKSPEELDAELSTSMVQFAPKAGQRPQYKVRANPQAEELYKEGRNYCLRGNHSRGLELLMQAIEMGSVNAQSYVGGMYLYGDHVNRDSALAFNYLLSAANGGNAEAVFQVAEMYNSGTGVDKDKKEARYWYERAAELGDDRAESRLRNL